MNNRGRCRILTIVRRQLCLELGGLLLADVHLLDGRLAGRAALLKQVRTRLGLRERKLALRLFLIGDDTAHSLAPRDAAPALQQERGAELTV